MVKERTFYSRFKILIILTNLSTTYVPGLESYPKDNLWILLCLLGALLPIICGLDVILLSAFGNLPLIESIGLIFLGWSYLWNSLKRLLFLTGARKIEKAIRYFDTELEPPFWPEVRDSLFNKYYRKIMKAVYLSFAFVLGPMLCVTTVKLFWTKVLFFRSYLDKDNYNFEHTDMRIILLQGVTILVLNASWIMSEAFVALIMCVIISEYEYLTWSFEKIIELVNKNDLARFRKQLGLWIVYHGKVIKLTRLIEKFYVPIFAGSLISITINFIGNIFNSITVKMPVDVALLTYVYAVPRILVMHKLCQYGDKIKSLSGNLFGRNIPTSLAQLPIDLTKSLLVIGEMARRPSVIRVGNNARLDSTTFRKLLYVLYRFATFLQEMQHRTKQEKKDFVG